jgi:flagellar protein FliS
MNEHAAQTYRQQQVNTASPAKMVFMLYEKTLSRLNEVLHAIEIKDIQSRCNANCHAQELLAHLSNTLDMEQGGEISANLERLFAHCMIRLMDVDRHNSPEAAQEVINLLSPIRDAWAELAERSEDELRQAIMIAQQDRSAPDTAAAKAPATGSDKAPAPAQSGLSISA